MVSGLLLFYLLETLTMRYFFSTFFLCLCSFGAFAQQKVVIERYSQSHLFGAVNQVLSDRNGEKWVACDNGVYKMSNFESAPQKINGDGSAKAFASNKKGDIWAAFDNNYIRNVKNGTYIKIPGDKVSVNEIKLFASQLWVGTNQGLMVFNTNNEKLLKHHKTSNSKLKSNQINFIHRDVFNTIWVGTAQGILKYEDKEWKKIYDKKHDFRVIAENEDGLWIISDKEMYLVYKEDGGTRWQPIGLRDDIYQGTINDMTLDNQGKLYLASDKLVRVDPYEDIIESYTDDVGLLSSKCLSLSSDKYNHVYIGTGDAGLFRLRFADNETNQLSASCILVKPISCNGKRDAELKVSTSGGTEPYKYKWSDAKIKGNNPKRVAAGTYEVTVTDKNLVDFVIDITFNEPDPVKIDVVHEGRISSSRKKDGAASIKASGGRGNYTYKWDNGEEAASALALTAGDHKITVTDSNNCSAVASVNISKEKILPDLDISKVTVGQTLRINKLFFEADSSVVDEKSFEVMDEIFEFLVDNPEVVIEIGGHTNNIPSHKYCDRLSSARSKECAEYLYNQGISEDRISYKGYGKRKPIASNESLAGRKRNQRVEIKILQIK